jgi:DNA processing protein
VSTDEQVGTSRIAAGDDPAPWVRLSRTGLAARRLNLLLDHYGSAASVFAASPEALRRVPGMSDSAVERLLDPEAARVEDDLRRMDQLGVRLVTRAHPGYPPLLRQIFDPPAFLFVLGSLSEEDRCAVSLVGSRRCSAYGRVIAERLARDLAAAGVAVVSGLARGVDTAAHHGALAAGGRTVAVLGSGLGRIYPPENRNLAARIAETGAVVSEFPISADPDAWHFPARNRIISGWCQGVCVVEAPADSGALITAEFAVEQGRDVFAVPGPVNDARSRGAHALIRDGAALVETAEDILAALGVLSATADPQLTLPDPALTEDEQALLKLLGPQPRSVDDLTAESGASAARVSAALMLLELKGLARRCSGTGYVRVFGRVVRER